MLIVQANSHLCLECSDWGRWRDKRRTKGLGARAGRMREAAVREGKGGLDESAPRPASAAMSQQGCRVPGALVQREE